MNQQDYTGYSQSTSEQAQSHGQIQIWKWTSPIWK